MRFSIKTMEHNWIEPFEVLCQSYSSQPAQNHHIQGCPSNLATQTDRPKQLITDGLNGGFPPLKLKPPDPTDRQTLRIRPKYLDSTTSRCSSTQIMVGLPSLRSNLIFLDLLKFFSTHHRSFINFDRTDQSSSRAQFYLSYGDWWLVVGLIFFHKT